LRYLEWYLVELEISMIKITKRKIT
jgi:hypothetical protein